MKKIHLLLVVVLISGLSGMVMGDSDYYDHLEVRSLVEEGRIKPLEEILRIVNDQRPGYILEIEMERENGRYIYEIEMLGEDGRVWELEVDAETGETIEFHLED